MTKWTGTQSLGNSTLTDDGVTLTSTTNISFTGTTNDLGTGAGTNQFYGLNYFYGNARFDGEIRDNAGAAGTSGQVLSSTGTTVQWKSVVDGSGIAGKLPKWLDSDTLTDSSVSDVAGAVAITSSTFTCSTNGNQDITSGTGALTFAANGVSGAISLTSLLDLRLDSQNNIEFNASNITSKIINYSPAEFKKTILDSTGGAGTSGQVLSSTGTATQWINGASSTISPTGSRYVSGVVSSAELLGLNGAPKVLVPAPGAGKLLVIEMLSYFLDFNTTPYVVSGSPGIYFASNIAISGRYIAVGSALWTSGADSRSVSIDTFFDNLKIDDALVLGTTGTLTGGDSVFYYYLSYKILNATDMSPVLT